MKMYNKEITEVCKALLPQCTILKKAAICDAEEEELEGMKVIQIWFKIKGFPGETLRFEQAINVDASGMQMFKTITDIAWTATKVCRDKLMVSFLEECEVEHKIQEANINKTKH